MDIEFLFDETLEEQQNQIKLILKELNKSNKEGDIARSFLRGCLLAFRKEIKKIEVVNLGKLRLRNL